MTTIPNVNLYPEFVAGLAASTSHPDKVPPYVLRQILWSALDDKRKVDGAKKALFYGKPNGYIEALVGELPTMIQKAGYQSEHMELIHAIVGIRSEADELIELLLKVLAGEVVTGAELIDEGGDLLWYTQLLANAIKSNLPEMVAVNMKKLMKRYPDGFSEARALNPDKASEAIAQAA